MAIARLLEKDIQRQILHYLKLIGAMPIRVNSMAVAGDYKGRKRFVRSNSEPGCSDILCCYRGRFFALEVKRPGNKLTAEQASFQEAVRRAGGVAAVVTSVEDAMTLVESVTP